MHFYLYRFAYLWNEWSHQQNNMKTCGFAGVNIHSTLIFAILLIYHVNLQHSLFIYLHNIKIHVRRSD